MNEGLVGVWRLVSYETAKPDGSVVQPFGPHVTGMLIYTADGCMSGQVMRNGRAPLPAAYRKSGASEFIAAAFDGYIAYCGRWRHDASRGEVVHIVEASLYPNWVGSEQRRGVLLEGDRLTLSAATIRADGEWISRLVWRKDENV